MAADPTANTVPGRLRGAVVPGGDGGELPHERVPHAVGQPPLARVDGRPPFDEGGGRCLTIYHRNSTHILLNLGSH